MRWLVGDIQGCVEPFERLLEEIRFDPAQDEIWCLGDLVNRGPESAATLRLWLDIGGKGLLGNHDLYALLAVTGIAPRRRDTLDDLFAAEDRDRLVGALRALPVMVHLPAPHPAARDVWIVHAGLHPHWTDLVTVAARLNATVQQDAGLQDDEVAVATRVRCCTAQGELARSSGPPHECAAPYQPWDEYYEGSTLIVHGHWAQRGHYRTERSMGLDSGYVHGGPLTAWSQDEDRIVQIDWK